MQKDSQKKRGRPKKSTNNESIVKKEVNFMNIISDTDSDDNIIGLSDYNSSEDDNFSNISSSERIRELEKKIRDLQDDVEYYKKMIDDANYAKKYTNSFSRIADYKLVHFDTGKSILVDKTDNHCWWCTYQFDNFPCFIPMKLVDNTYHVYGNFCSPNCAYAYNFTMKDYKMHDRINLIKRFYSILFDKPMEIKAAPDREILTKFGGSVDIDDYRRSSISMDISFRLRMPPIKPIYPSIECEVKKDVTVRENDLVLKRSKPFKNNSLIFR